MCLVPKLQAIALSKRQTLLHVLLGLFNLLLSTAQRLQLNEEMARARLRCSQLLLTLQDAFNVGATFVLQSAIVIEHP